jgi:pimeloyl-ACP methyl ester carboxylesterase
MLVDANNDGIIAGGESASQAKPFSFWLNDDDDVNGVNGWQSPDYANSKVDGEDDLKDLKDFFPVFLDIQQVVQAIPPSATVKYKLKHADAAVNFVETKLTRQTAFSFKDNAGIGYGDSLQQTAGNATTTQVTATGVELSDLFLTNIRDFNKGVILVEGRTPTTKPLVLTVEENGVERLRVSLPLALNARILLLLHGMNSNTQTWNTFVQQQIGYPAAKWATDIRVDDKAITGARPMLSSTGVRCYRLQFGGYEVGNPRMGLEDLTAAIAPNYLADRKLRQCGDFETFPQLGQEVDDAITLLLARPEYQNAQIILVGHSRGGIAARAFLQMAGANASKTAVVGFLTIGTPHTGSRMGRIYKWLKDNPRPTPPATNDDWAVVKTLFDAPAGLDIRRPVNGDVADNSDAMVNLNLPAEVAKMPADIRYGQIVYANSDLGRLARTFIPDTSIPFVYTVLGSHLNIGPQLSDAAQTSILGGVAPAGYPGDGLIPRQGQKFPAGVLSNGGNIVTLENLDDDVLHTEEPGRDQDLHLQLIGLMRHWFFRP